LREAAKQAAEVRCTLDVKKFSGNAPAAEARKLLAPAASSVMVDLMAFGGNGAGARRLESA
jgi:hypothetical protein